MLSVFSGSRAEIGEAHGRTHAALITSSIEVYDRLFHDFVGLRWAEARRVAERFVPMIERGFPEILDEMAGIARGAGLDLEDILTLNCRSEISLTQASGGCTALSINRDGTQWLAQNWDWRSDQLHNVVAMELRPTGAPSLVSVGEAGMVAKIGLNENGVGVCLNAIRSRTLGEGLPIHVALRKILEAESFDAATRVVTHDRVCSPAHFLIASGDGRSAGFEVHPGLPGVLEPRGGAVTHTNHLYAETATCQVEDFPRPDSGTRLTRIDALLRERLPLGAAVDAEALFAMLADHDNAPLSICRHFNPDQPAEERMETLFAVVMNLRQRRLVLRHGKPCEGEDTLTVTLGDA
ncbi:MULTISPECIES: C45 family autoproteolytic acyltransferase/hydolase [Halomonas]|uniref:Acyl-CoA--6-aminopenicillanic acid acyl-transferase n=1 Tax=Halomonas halophila TaxID=29573 RepID=A0ABQ0U6T4_9GAMM|nr:MULTISPECIES: C45 family peptidase [Halomonas]MDR5888946.1 C45 family autoproteolytic acyltransferase/hydrolase [Halomonas salina]WJY07490.1 C45 family autoproteolytic acyltransferase/hydrolase [Halomonas halophila]GEK73423.1 acyl-CoA--6-aminopenicillanic acid acyl-transferase [Halomonas halophila]